MTSSTINTFAVRAYFAKLGLAPEIADIYLALLAYGPQNMMQLARNAEVERTRLYRLIDTMSEMQLIEIEKEYKRNIIKAAPISNIQILLSKKEEELRELQHELNELHSQIAYNTLTSPMTRVQFYRGEDGVKQMFWNQTKAQTDTCAIMYENMQNKTKAAFFERWVRRCNERDMHFRGIIGGHFIQTQQQWYGEHSNERLVNWESRYASDTLLPITHSTITYDDVVAYYNWKDGEIFGIEMYNDQIAATQRHLFEMVWVQATPVDDLVGPQTTQRTDA